MPLEIGISPETFESLREYVQHVDLPELINAVQEFARRILTPPNPSETPSTPLSLRQSIAGYLSHRPVVSTSPSFGTVKLALPSLDSIRAQPFSLRSYLPHTTSPTNPLSAILPSPAVQYLDRFFSTSTASELATTSALALLVAALLALPFMATWRNYFGGRYSPFTSTAPTGGPPRVTDDDYHYLGPDDIVDPPRDSMHANPNRHGHLDDDASQPDILILKHRGTTYPMHFPAYSIGEGVLRVGELRRYASEKTGTSDPRRIKLLYKGRVLKDDAVACCEEGLKQNSELMCVVSEAPARGGGPSSEDSGSASEEDFARARQSRRAASAADGAGSGIPGAGVRVSVDGTIIDEPPRSARRAHGRGETSSTRNRDRERGASTTDNGHLSAGPTAGTATSSATPTPSASPKPQQASNVPKTANEKLDDITHNLRMKWMPLVDQFISNPPRDQKTRQTEYTRLSESILSQVVLKLDDILTDGDTDLRTRRRAMVVETQKVLSDLDVAWKGRAS